MRFFKNKKKKKVDITLKKTSKEQKKNPTKVENKKTENKKSTEAIKKILQLKQWMLMMM